MFEIADKCSIIRKKLCPTLVNSSFITNLVMLFYFFHGNSFGDVGVLRGRSGLIMSTKMSSKKDQVKGSLKMLQKCPNIFQIITPVKSTKSLANFLFLSKSRILDE